MMYAPTSSKPYQSALHLKVLQMSQMHALLDIPIKLISKGF